MVHGLSGHRFVPGAGNCEVSATAIVAADKGSAVPCEAWATVVIALPQLPSKPMSRIVTFEIWLIRRTEIEVAACPARSFQKVLPRTPSRVMLPHGKSIAYGCPPSRLSMYVPGGEYTMPPSHPASSALLIAARSS